MDKTERLARYLRRLAHDMRNASSLLTLNLDMLRHEVSSQRARACLADSDEAVRRLEKMAQELSRSMSPAEIEVQDIDLRQVVAQAIGAVEKERIREVAPDFGVKPWVEGEAKGRGPIAFFLDSTAILLQNAFDALEGPQSHPRHISILLKESPLSVTIRNSGPRISDEIVTEIFEPFVSAVPHERFRSGLGLTRARRFAARVNGKVELIENSDHGVAFCLTVNPEGSRDVVNEAP